MTHHSLDRQSGRALAALSATICVPIRRIGFLIVPLIWWLGGSSLGVGV
jgi:hypothetical protein